VEEDAVWSGHPALQDMRPGSGVPQEPAATPFWSTLKLDCLEGKNYRTRQEATLAIFAYLVSFYNHSRRHSSLGYLSPVAFEMAKN
jgi:transposase InsO family protein